MSLLKRLTIHNMLQGMRLGLFAAISTLFLLEKGIELWHIGFLFGVWTISSAILELPLGALSDEIGRIRVFKLGLFAQILFLLLAAFSSSFPLLLVAMAIGGLASALETGTISAWQVEQFRIQLPHIKLVTLISKFRAINALFIAFGALLGGYLPELASTIKSTSAQSTTTLVIAAVIAVLHLLLLPSLFKEGDHLLQTQESQLKNIQKTALAHCLYNPPIRALLYLLFPVGVVMSNIEYYWQPYIKLVHNITYYNTFGWLAMGYFLAAALGPIIFGRITKTTNASSELQIIIILILSSIFLFLLPKQQTLLGFIICHWGFIATLVTVNIPIEVILNKHTEDQIRSASYSILSLILMSGGATSAFGLAFAVQKWGIGIVWTGLSSLLFLVGLVKLCKFYLRSTVPTHSHGD